MKGSGKTYLTTEITREFPRVVVVDALGEYDRAQGFQETFGFEHSLSVLEYLAKNRVPRYRVSCIGLDPTEAEILFGFLWNLRGILLVVEEATLYCSPHTFPPNLAQLVLRGRHQAISQVYTSQRPSGLNRNVTAQSDLVVSFHQHEPLDVAYLRQFMGPDRAQRLLHLRDYQILVYGNLSKAPVSILEKL